MSDIFQEVEEDLRRERLKRAWDRYGIYVIATAVLIVAITAGYRGWDAWTTSRARTAGDEFATLLQEADDALPATAADRLVSYAAEAPEGYAMLARFRAASAHADAGEPERATELLRALSDEAPRALYRELARVRLASLLIDTGDTAAARDAVADIAADSGRPFYRSAQEMMGLAAYAANDIPAARGWYEAIAEGADTSRNMSQRADVMLSLFDQIAGPPASGTDAGPETN